MVLGTTQKGKTNIMLNVLYSNAFQLAIFLRFLNFWKMNINYMNAVFLYEPEEPGKKGSIRGKGYACILLKECTRILCSWVQSPACLKQIIVLFLT